MIPDEIPIYRSNLDLVSLPDWLAGAESRSRSGTLTGNGDSGENRTDGVGGGQRQRMMGGTGDGAIDGGGRKGSDGGSGSGVSGRGGGGSGSGGVRRRSGGNSVCLDSDLSIGFPRQRMDTGTQATITD